MGALGFDTVVLPPPSLTRRRDPNANEETHYDAIRVGSIVMRQGPMERESSLLFGVASRLAKGWPSIRCDPRCLRYGGAVEARDGRESYATTDTPNRCLRFLKLRM